MKAWLINKLGPLSKESLVLKDFPEPQIGPGEILIKVLACGICHTELDEIEGRVEPAFLPIIPGHQIVGVIISVGDEVSSLKVGDLVGAGWIYESCGNCEFCKRDLENLCPKFKATGKDAHGGYSEYFKISEKYVIPLPKSQSPEKVAPLLCAGAIGYRALKLSNLEKGNVLGLIGFGASNHLVLKMAKILYPKSYFIVFARNPKERELALNLGAHLALDLKEKPPEQLHAIIDTTPVWEPPFFLLRYLKPGGRLVINAIRKEDVDKDILKKLSYERDLWLEKEIKSVANITRKDLREFISLAINYGIEPEVEIYPLGGALEALFDIKNRKIRGAKVLKIT